MNFTYLCCLDPLKKSQVPHCSKPQEAEEVVRKLDSEALQEGLREA